MLIKNSTIATDVISFIYLFNIYSICILYVAQQSYQCRVALFSLSSFDVQGKVEFPDWTKDFCQVDNEGYLFDENSSSIAVALRGNCTFDVKASTAYKLGYKVLYIRVIFASQFV